MSLSHSTTGGDTRKNLELLVLDKKYLRCLSRDGELEIDVHHWIGFLLDSKWCSHRSQTQWSTSRRSGKAAPSIRSHRQCVATQDKMHLKGGTI